jgi:hypothetical protein
MLLLFVTYAGSRPPILLAGRGIWPDTLGECILPVTYSDNFLPSL